MKQKISRIWNAVSEYDSTTIKELQNLRDLFNDKLNQYMIKDFFGIKILNSIIYKCKRRIKNLYLRKPVRLYNWNQPKKRFESYTLTVLPHEKMIQNKESFDNSYILPFVLHPQSDPARGKINSKFVQKKEIAQVNKNS